MSNSPIVTYLSTPSQWDWAFIKDCFSISFWSMILLIVLEYLTWDKEWSKKIKDDKISALYKQAIKATSFHFAVIGPIAYGGSYWVVLNNPKSLFPWYISIIGVYIVQAAGYASAHAWMHKPANYWIHKMHHQYNEISFIRPISANTVTVTEFSIAYALPIVTGLLLFRPTINDMWWVTMTISATNFLIHTPPTILNMKWAPNWLITNDKHFHHHEKDVRMHYSAPIFDFDKILNIGQKNQYKGDPKMGSDKME